MSGDTPMRQPTTVLAVLYGNQAVGLPRWLEPRAAVRQNETTVKTCLCELE